MTNSSPARPGPDRCSRGGRRPVQVAASDQRHLQLARHDCPDTNLPAEVIWAQAHRTSHGRRRRVPDQRQTKTPCPPPATDGDIVSRTYSTYGHALRTFRCVCVCVCPVRVFCSIPPGHALLVGGPGSDRRCSVRILLTRCTACVWASSSSWTDRNLPWHREFFWPHLRHKLHSLLPSVSDTAFRRLYHQLDHRVRHRPITSVCGAPGTKSGAPCVRSSTLHPLH